MLSPAGLASPRGPQGARALRRYPCRCLPSRSARGQRRAGGGWRRRGCSPTGCACSPSRCAPRRSALAVLGGRPLPRAGGGPCAPAGTRGRVRPRAGPRHRCGCRRDRQGGAALMGLDVTGGAGGRRRADGAGRDRRSGGAALEDLSAAVSRLGEIAGTSRVTLLRAGVAAELATVALVSPVDCRSGRGGAGGADRPDRAGSRRRRVGRAGRHREVGRRPTRRGGRGDSPRRVGAGRRGAGRAGQAPPRCRRGSRRAIRASTSGQPRTGFFAAPWLADLAGGVEELGGAGHCPGLRGRPHPSSPPQGRAAGGSLSRGVGSRSPPSRPPAGRTRRRALPICSPPRTTSRGRRASRTGSGWCRCRRPTAPPRGSSSPGRRCGRPGLGRTLGPHQRRAADGPAGDVARSRGGASAPPRPAGRGTRRPADPCSSPATARAGSWPPRSPPTPASAAAAGHARRRQRCAHRPHAGPGRRLGAGAGAPAGRGAAPGG